jgi:hypothetical protein
MEAVFTSETWLHVAISQNALIVMLTAVRTRYLTNIYFDLGTTLYRHELSKITFNCLHETLYLQFIYTCEQDLCFYY